MFIYSSNIKQFF